MGTQKCSCAVLITARALIILLKHTEDVVNDEQASDAQAGDVASAVVMPGLFKVI